MRGELPVNPLSIELTLAHRRSWWDVSVAGHPPEPWDISADVWELDVCPQPLRHVADFSLAVVDLRRRPALIDASIMGEWGLDFVTAAVADDGQGRLHPELEARISPGVPRVVILRSVELAPPWRGYGLGPRLVAGALGAFASTARLAACRVTPNDIARLGADRRAAETLSGRMTKLLHGIGFRVWNGTHVLDLPGSATAGVLGGKLGRRG